MISNIQYRVKFSEVGRDKKSWEITMPSLCVEAALKSVRKNGGLMSRFPDVEILEDGTGYVSAGFHTVGKIEWKEEVK